MKHKQLLLWLFLFACLLSALSNTSLEGNFYPSTPAVDDDDTLSTTTTTTLRSDNINFSPSTIRHTCIDLRDQDRNIELLSYLESVERFYGSLEIDEELPTLYNFKAVALYELGSIHEAGLVLKRAVAYNSNDLRSWINLLEIFHYDSSLGNPQQTVDMVEQLSGQTSLNERYSSLRWVNIEWLEYKQDQLMISCLRNTSDSESCDTIVFGPSSYVDEMHLRSYQSYLNKKSQTSASTHHPFVPNSPTHPPPPVVVKDRRRLVVGFIFGTIDGGPVPKLLSSLMRRFDKRKITTVAYILSTTNTVKEAWILELLSSFHERVSLSDRDFRDSAAIISRRGLHVLVDVNGHQLLSGVTLMRLRPCGLQVNYLGDALTSNFDYIDYYIGDRVSNPPDINSHHFTEKLSLLPTSYLSNSYLDLTVDNILRPAYPKEDLFRRLALNIATGQVVGQGVPFDEDTMLLGAFHGHSKITPMMFQVWTNILRSAGNSRLVMSQPSSTAALTNLISELNYAGIMTQSSSNSSSSRVLILPHSGWFEHVYYKSAVDVYMDTIVKNGHTTTLDAAWGGIPIVGLAGQSRATQRSTESISRYLFGDLDNSCGLVYSLKEYEDTVIALIATRRGRRRLQHWKRIARLMRLHSSFFNPIQFADSFTHNLQALYEMHSIRSSISSSSSSSSNSSNRVDTLYHIFHSSTLQ